MYPYLKERANKPCSHKCIFNWIDFKQKPPIGHHYCNCCPLKNNLKSKTDYKLNGT